MVGGATGHLGGLVVKAPSTEGAEIVAIVRPGTAEGKLAPLHAANVKTAEADLANGDQLRTPMLGAGCVVSTLQVLREVIVDGQAALWKLQLPQVFRASFHRTLPWT